MYPLTNLTDNDWVNIKEGNMYASRNGKKNGGKFCRCKVLHIEMKRKCVQVSYYSFLFLFTNYFWCLVQVRTTIVSSVSFVFGLFHLFYDFARMICMCLYISIFIIYTCCDLTKSTFLYNSSRKIYWNKIKSCFSMLFNTLLYSYIQTM